MNKGALALLIHGGTENWSPERWKRRFDDVCRDRRVLLLPDTEFDPAEIHYAAVWKPDPGELAAFPNLRVIFNLGAGVDALMADSSLPKVPLVRVAVGDLTGRMTEYVALHVLMHHRQELYLRASQREKRWAAEISMAGERDFGRHHGPRHARIERGRRAPASRLSRVGLEPKSESRSTASTAFTAKRSSMRFCGRTDILVCLLPLTPDTRHILNRGMFAKLNRNSPMGAPVLINAGRGGLQNEADILECLDDGTLGAASLDVFAQEPLPADSPFWTHPKVVLTPHNAADTDPDEISKYVARQIERFEAGGALENVVDPARGY